MAVSIGNMTSYSKWYIILVADKGDFNNVMAVSIALCLIGIVVLAIVLTVKVRKQRVSRLPWRTDYNKL
jgi:ABC-type sulfate transport system permease component